MIVAYIGSAAVSAGVYLMLRRKPRKTRLTIAVTVFSVLCALVTVWFINTGGTYGIIGKNGITPDWANEH
ncbi:hypothetical protein [Vibrio sp.]|uniref:hypothetical protein n=1 Tax=Vibrio sp. TaxID=678 RepID=UPI003AA8C904